MHHRRTLIGDRDVEILRHINKGRRRIAGLGIGAALALGIAVIGSPTAQADSGSSVTCTDKKVPVALAQGQPANSEIFGELCATRGELASGTTVQLLLHPGNNNHTYWDFGTIDGVQYSYARDAAANGYPTFAIDEIGSGQSTHPSSSLVDLPMASYVTHQVVQGLHDGAITGKTFDKVIDVGHDSGAFMAWQEAVDYADVQGVIATGIIQGHVSQAFLNFVTQDFYPASQDPKFQNSGYDCASFPASCYITTKPGTRTQLWNQANADPNVIAAEEASKDVWPSGEQQGQIMLLFGTATKAINVPVLTVMGGSSILCGTDSQGVSIDCSSPSAIAQQEAPFYSENAHLQACSVPKGDDFFALDLNHRALVTDAIAWSNRFVGQDNQDVQGDQNNTWPTANCAS